MREYIIYAILIFLPLGFLMACFLNKQGFSKKQIFCFTIAALAAVILFPISAAKMGTTATGLIFVFILAFFSWQIMEAEQVLKGEKVSEHPKIDQIEALPPDADIASGPGMAETAAEPDTTEAEDLPIIGQDETEPDMIQFIRPATEEDKCAAETEDVLAGMVDNTENDSPIDILPAPSEQIDHNGMEQNDQPTPEEEIEDATSIADVFTDEELHEESYTESDSPQVVTMAEVTHEADNQDNKREINSLIDEGFENKINDNIQGAIRCFESAFQLTDSADLKYLLSQELVLHYEILGQYTKAINITKNTIGSGLIPTAGLNQAQHKLEYLQRMVEELERLGMGEVPGSEVPRLVKIKVGQITR